MTRFLLTIGLVFSGILPAVLAKAIISYDILSQPAKVECKKGNASATLEKDGSLKFVCDQEARDSWIRIPIKLEDLKVYDQLQIDVETQNEKSAAVLEINCRLNNELLIKRNLFFKRGQSVHVFNNIATLGIKTPPSTFNLRMINNIDNMHLPESVIDHPIYFKAIKLNVTEEGIKLLTREMDSILDVSRYQAISLAAEDAAKMIAEQLRQKFKNQADVLVNSSSSPDARILAATAMYNIKETAGWEIELAALQADNSKKVLCFWTGGSDKIMRDGSSFPGNFSGPAKSALGKNETEGIQVALFSQHDLKDVTYQCSDLKGPDGSKLPVKVMPVGYVMSHDAAYITPYNERWIADPLLPYLKKFDVEKNKYQPVWIDFESAKAQKPGKYTGAIKFFEQGKEIAAMPIEVEVWNFTLPDQMSLPLAFSCDYQGYNNIIARLVDNDCEVLQEFTNYMFSENPDLKKLSPAARRLVDRSNQAGELFRAHHIPFSDFYRGTYDVIPEWRRNEIMKKDNLFCFGYNKSKHVMEELKPQVEAMRKAGTAERGYIYGYDEITSKQAFEGLISSYGKIKKAFPEIKTTCTALDYTFGKRSGVTDEIDIWIVPITEYVESMEAMKEPRSKGQKVWWYPCNWPYPPSANLLLESNANATRLVIGFMPWKYQVQGFLYYATTMWVYQADDSNFLGEWKTSSNVAMKKFGSQKPFNEYIGAANRTERDVSIRQWANLEQKDTTPITFKFDYKINAYKADSKSTCLVRVKIKNNKNEMSEQIFQLNPEKKDWQHFEQRLEPKEPIKAVFVQLQVNSDDAKVEFKNSRLTQDGKSRKSRFSLDHPITGGPLIDCQTNVFGSNGDGSLFYPGENEILPCLRTKFLRDGLEDYEYLIMLKQTVADVKSGKKHVDNKDEWLKKADALLTVSPEVCTDLDVYAQKGSDLLKYRNEIGEMLNQIK